jgi:hypothetical protein
MTDLSWCCNHVLCSGKFAEHSGRKKSAGIGERETYAKPAGCDFRQIQKDQHKLGLSLILGGCGATLEELTGLLPHLPTRFIQTITVYKRG